MTFRNSNSPDDQFEYELRSFDRRLTAMEMRSMWPSAVQQASDTPEIPMTIQDPGDPAYPDSAIATHGTGITLDPGRWVLLARAYMSLLMTGGAGRELGMMLRTYSTSMGGIDKETRVFAGGPDGVTDISLSMAMEVISDTPISVVVKGWAGALPPYSFAFADLYTADVVAFPG